jgi:hypothetical protein
VNKKLGDLSPESNVIVKRAVAIGSMDTSSERGCIWWFDGSTWYELTTYHWEYNKKGWLEVTAPVPSSWLATDNRVELRGYGGSGDHVVFDRLVVADMLHEYTKPAAPSGLTIDNSVEDELTWDATMNAVFDPDLKQKRTNTDTGDTDTDSVDADTDAGSVDADSDADEADADGTDADESDAAATDSRDA